MAAKKSSGVHVGWNRPNFVYVVKTNKYFKAQYNAALLYAHYEMSAAELKKEVIKYLKSVDLKHPLLDRMKGIHENRFAVTGKYAFVVNNKGDLPDDIQPRLIPAIEQAIAEEEERLERVAKTEVKVNDTPVVVKPVISIQDRIKEKAREAAGEIEGWIDDFYCDRKSAIKTVDEFANYFKACDLKAPHVRFIEQIFQRRADEIELAYAGTDKELSTAYANFSKTELKKFHLFFTNLIKACGMLQEVAKVERMPRKKKPVSQDKLVAKLKYKKEDSTLGIVSANPVQIIGAKEVWVYNTKTRKLAQYKALDANGLTVKGASLLNYSPDSAEKTLRKPVEALADFKKASKVKLRTFLKELSTVDIPCQGKLNEHHVILRVDK